MSSPTTEARTRHECSQRRPPVSASATSNRVRSATRSPDIPTRCLSSVSRPCGKGRGTDALTHGFAVFGYHVTGSTGTLFLSGIVVGAVALLGLSVLLAGARRTSRRGHAARRGLKQSRQETAAAIQDRDDLLEQREAARTETPGRPADGS